MCVRVTLTFVADDTGALRGGVLQYDIDRLGYLDDGIGRLSRSVRHPARVDTTCDVTQSQLKHARYAIKFYGIVLSSDLKPTYHIAVTKH